MNIHNRMRLSLTIIRKHQGRWGRKIETNIYVYIYLSGQFHNEVKVNEHIGDT